MKLAIALMVGIVGGAILAPRPARACGGCFVPPGTTTVVTGHRMAMTVSPSQSVLWDQIQYSGEPEDFAWVLPVKPGARLEASTSAFFEILEYVTAVRVQEPWVDCGGSDGCGPNVVEFSPRTTGEEVNLSEDGSNSSGGAVDPVEVVHQGTVGPYETVTLATDTPGALNDWLDDHGYNVDDASQPIIDQYVEEGFDFIALRLQPGKDVREMTPVRVVSPGSNVTLPLRMVAIGAGAETPLILYVIGEGRYRVKDFEDVRVDQRLLWWDFKSDLSNYSELREAALDRAGGKAWLTAYSLIGTLMGPAGDEKTGPMLFPQRYAKQALDNGEIMSACTLSFDQPLGLGRVVNPCPPGEPWTSAACGQLEEDEVDARKFGCTGAEDVSVALEGLHLSDVHVTRLEASLPRNQLATDMELEASAEQEFVPAILQATIALHPEYACGEGAIVASGRSRGRGLFDTPLGIAAGACALALLARARRPKRIRFAT